MTHEAIAAALQSVADEIKSRLDAEFPGIPEFRAYVEVSAWSDSNRSGLGCAYVYHDWMKEVDGRGDCGVTTGITHLADSAVRTARNKMKEAIAKAREKQNGLHEYAKRMEVTP